MNFLFAFVTYTVVSVGWGYPEMETTRFGVLDPGALPGEAASLAEVPLGAAIVSIGGEEVEHWGEVREAILEGPEGRTPVVFEAPGGEVEIQLAGSERRVAIFGAMDYWLDPVHRCRDPGRPGKPCGDSGGRPGGGGRSASHPDVAGARGDGSRESGEGDHPRRRAGRSPP